MTLCVAMLIASEFLPVSLLTAIAADLRATEGMAGQAISISGLFAVVTSLFIATSAGRFDRRHVLIVLTGIMLGAAFGGLLLDHVSVAAAFIGGTVLLVLASLIVGNGNRISGANGRP